VGDTSLLGLSVLLAALGEVFPDFRAAAPVLYVVEVVGFRLFLLGFGFGV
jgi:hypothetical protein